MTLFERIEALEATVAALPAAVVPIDQTAAIAAVKEEVDALAALVGTPKA